MTLSRLTARPRLDRDLHTLEGILKGVAIDGAIHPDEVAALVRWLDAHRDVAERSPFDQILPRLAGALEDGVLDEEERADLLWMIERCSTPNEYYNVITSDLQRLHGVLAGVGADGKLHDAEVHALSEWLEGVDHLSGSWPYDEIYSFVTHVLSDGVIDAKERKLLLGFCAEFASTHVDLLVAGDISEEFLKHGVCAVAPDVRFQEATFCLTGASRRAQRKEIEAIIAGLGGEPKDCVSRDLSYLVVCDGGSRHWAFSCYGRKVEQAMKLRRREQARIVILHEADLWDAVEDSGGKRPPAR